MCTTVHTQRRDIHITIIVLLSRVVSFMYNYFQIILFGIIIIMLSNQMHASVIVVGVCSALAMVEKGCRVNARTVCLDSTVPEQKKCSEKQTNLWQ